MTPGVPSPPAGPPSDRPAPDRPAPGERAAAADVQLRLAYDRTYLANERTYAAWLRTGLAIAAGGITVAHLVPAPSRDAWVALGLGSAFVGGGVGVMAYGGLRFTRTAAALARQEGPAAPGPSRLPHLLTAAVGALLLAVLLFLWTHQGRGADAAGASPARRHATASRQSAWIACSPAAVASDRPCFACRARGSG